MKQTTICVASLLGGMIVGSALAMLLTPQSGPELRHRIHEAMAREMERTKEEISHLKEELERARCHCGDNEEQK